MSITIYTNPTCPYCAMAKDFFRDKKLPFKELDVSQDQKNAEEMIKLSGQMAVPVIQIGDEVIIGFDRSQVEKALK